MVDSETRTLAASSILPYCDRVLSMSCAVANGKISPSLSLSWELLDTEACLGTAAHELY